jgi:hypothetical protein
MVSQRNIITQHDFAEPMGTEKDAVAQDAAIAELDMALDLQVGGQELTVLPHALEALRELPPAQSLQNSHTMKSFARYFTHPNRHGTMFVTLLPVERRHDQEMAY